MQMLKNCPICNQQEAKKYLEVKDNSVSKETFTIEECESCGFKFTNPRPDATEIGRYYQSEEYVSHNDSNKGLINGLYQLVKKYTLWKKLNLMVQISGKKTGKLLDYGCGTGDFIKILHDVKWEVNGLEPDEGARKLAQNKVGEERVKDLSKLNSLDNNYDVITCWHVVEHIHELNSTLEKLIAAMHPKGKLLIAVPNITSYDSVHYKEFWAALDVPRHLYHFRPLDIENLAKNHGLKLERTLPMVFDSFYVSMLSEKYKGGNILKAFWIGLLSNLKAASKANDTYSSQIYILQKN
jgi:2-polyprenyl-3-methyl-5-hydroxy-6-metoxy-1,4-benzoquinol methylase